MKFFFFLLCPEPSTENMELNCSHELISFVSAAFVCFYFCREGRMTTDSVVTRFRELLNADC